MTPRFPHPNRGMVLGDPSPTSSSFSLRGFHLLWQAIPGHFSLTGEEEAGPITPHFPQVSLRDSVWTFPSSLAATEGIPFWFLFLPLLRCFRSGGSRSLMGASRFRRTLIGSPIEESPVLRLHALTRGFFAVGRALLQRSSRAIHQTA